VIVCSCAVISDRDIETALLELAKEPSPLVPTPGVIHKHLGKRMVCCSCAPLAIETIYAKLEELERKGLVSRYDRGISPAGPVNGLSRAVKPGLGRGGTARHARAVGRR